MLLCNVVVGIGDFLRQQQSIVFQPNVFSKLLEFGRPKHFPKGVGSVHCAINRDPSVEQDRPVMQYLPKCWRPSRYLFQPGSTDRGNGYERHSVNTLGERAVRMDRRGGVQVGFKDLPKYFASRI